MSMVAVFALECCGRNIVHGRFKGDDMYPPSLERCPFGCPPSFYPSGRPAKKTLRFIEYKHEQSAQEPRTWNNRPVPAAEAIERGLV